MKGSVVLTALILISLLGLTIPVAADTSTNTFYFRSDYHTVNGLYGRQLKTSQSSSDDYDSYFDTGNYTVSWGIRVKIRHVGGGTTELTSGSPVAIVNRTAGSSLQEGYQNNTWSCPETALETTDAILITMYVTDPVDPWLQAGQYITPQLGANTLNASSWNVYYYTWWDSDGSYTWSRFYFGIFYHDSRIENVITFTNPFQYTFFGAYTEQGIRDGAINVTVYHSDNTSETFEVDGSHSISPSAMPITAEYDLGYNVSRVVYFYLNQENFTIVNPTEPSYTYYIEVIDYVGVEWGYLETLLNINGTDTVIERWDVQILNELPFTLSWGKAYKLRLICNLGSYNYPSFVAGGSQTTSIAISQDIFDEIPTDVSGISLTATRVNNTWIRTIYVDSDNLTDTVVLDFYILGTSELQYSTEETTLPFIHNWYGADPEYHYSLKVSANHDRRGLLIWWIVLPADQIQDNVFADLDEILTSANDEFPIAASNFIGLGLTLLCAAAFSAKNIAVGVVITVIMTMILTTIGFMTMDWTWLTLSFAVAIIVAISIQKERVTTI